MDHLTSRSRLGCPIPLDEHGVSVCLPTHADTVGYEEGHSRVTSVLKIGYPRFKIHSAVALLMEFMSKQHARYRTLGDAAKGDEEDEEEEVGEDEAAARDFGCFVFPTFHVARRFQAFMESGVSATSEVSIRSVHFEGVTAVFFPKPLAAKAKAYWQHTGEIVSSRLAVDALQSFGKRLKSPIPSVTPLYSSSGRERHCKSDAYLQGASCEDAFEAAKILVQERIMNILEEPMLPNSIHLVPSGMAAIFSALRLSKALAESADTSASGRKTRIVVFGFPYLDTLKLAERPEFNEGGAIFLGHGDAADDERLRQILSQQESDSSLPRVCAVFTEMPSNPLLRVPNLKLLTELASRHNFLVAVDDTLGSFAHLDLLRPPGDASIDLLCSSLTKAFSGRGDVMAGSLVINSRGRHARKLRQLAGTMDFAPLYGPDSIVLEVNSRDYVARCKQIGRTAAKLASWLQEKGQIYRVYYPGVSPDCADDGQRFDSFRRRTTTDDEVVSRGHVFSIVLDDAQDTRKSDALKDAQMRVFFDALSCWKGPSLGTNFTLSCLYTLLAHYTELDWAATYGVDRRLVRVSVGLEDITLLKEMFSAALHAAARPALWGELHRVLVVRKGLPLQALVRILTFIS